MIAAFVGVSPVTSGSPSLFASSFVCRHGKAPQRVRASSSSRVTMMAGIGLFFDTMTGRTSDIADKLKEVLGADGPMNLADVDAEKMTGYDMIVAGAPTWNTGADTERSGTSWDEFLYNDLKTIDLSGKKVAIFGLGDSVGYSYNFCDAIEELHDNFQKRGATMIGYFPTDTYEYDESLAVRDGKFLGLPIDEDNQPDLTEDRVQSWAAQIQKEASA